MTSNEDHPSEPKHPKLVRREYSSVIDCGIVGDSGRREYLLHIDYFDQKVDVFTAVNDPHRQVLVRPNLMVQRLQVAPNRVSMFVQKLRETDPGVYQAVGFTHKPATAKPGIKIGAYFITVDVCKQIEEAFVTDDVILGMPPPAPVYVVADTYSVSRTAMQPVYSHQLAPSVSGSSSASAAIQASQGAAQPPPVVRQQLMTSHPVSAIGGVAHPSLRAAPTAAPVVAPYAAAITGGVGPGMHGLSGGVPQVAAPVVYSSGFPPATGAYHVSQGIPTSLLASAVDPNALVLGAAGTAAPVVAVAPPYDLSVIPQEALVQRPSSRPIGPAVVDPTNLGGFAYVLPEAAVDTPVTFLDVGTRPLPITTLGAGAARNVIPSVDARLARSLLTGGGLTTGLAGVTVAPPVEVLAPGIPPVVIGGGMSCGLPGVVIAPPLDPVISTMGLGGVPAEVTLPLAPTVPPYAAAVLPVDPHSASVMPSSLFTAPVVVPTNPLAHVPGLPIGGVPAVADALDPIALTNPAPIPNLRSLPVAGVTPTVSVNPATTVLSVPLDMVVPSIGLGGVPADFTLPVAPSAAPYVLQSTAVLPVDPNAAAAAVTPSSRFTAPVIMPTNPLGHLPIGGVPAVAHATDAGLPLDALNAAAVIPSSRFTAPAIVPANPVAHVALPIGGVPAVAHATDPIILANSGPTARTRPVAGVAAPVYLNPATAALSGHSVLPFGSAPAGPQFVPGVPHAYVAPHALPSGVAIPPAAGVVLAPSVTPVESTLALPVQTLEPVLPVATDVLAPGSRVRATSASVPLQVSTQGPSQHVVARRERVTPVWGNVVPRDPDVDSLQSQGQAAPDSDAHPSSVAASLGTSRTTTMWTPETGRNPDHGIP